MLKKCFNAAKLGMLSLMLKRFFIFESISMSGKDTTCAKRVAQAAPTAPSLGTRRRSPIMFKIQVVVMTCRGVSTSFCARSPAWTTMEVSTTGCPIPRTDKYLAAVGMSSDTHPVAVTSCVAKVLSTPPIINPLPRASATAVDRVSDACSV